MRGILNRDRSILTDYGQYKHSLTVLPEKYVLLLYFRRSDLEKRREYKEKYTERDGANKHDNNRSRSRERNSHSRYRT